MTRGKRCTLGTVKINLNGLPYILHVVPHNFPIDLNGIRGWDVFKKYKGYICAKNKLIILNNIEIHLLDPELFNIPAKTR